MFIVLFFAASDNFIVKCAVSISIAVIVGCVLAFTVFAVKRRLTVCGKCREFRIPNSTGEFSFIGIVLYLLCLILSLINFISLLLQTLCGTVVVSIVFSYKEMSLSCTVSHSIISYFIPQPQR